MQIVSNQDDRTTVPAKLAQPVAQHGACGGVQAGERLVEKKNRGMVERGPGNGEALFHAPGKPADTVRVPCRKDRRPPAPLAHVLSGRADRKGGHRNAGFHLRSALRREGSGGRSADVRPHAFRFLTGVHAPDKDPPVRGFGQGRNKPQERRLAGPVRAEKSKGATWNDEVDTSRAARRPNRFSTFSRTMAGTGGAITPTLPHQGRGTYRQAPL